MAANLKIQSCKYNSCDALRRPCLNGFGMIQVNLISPKAPDPYGQELHLIVENIGVEPMTSCVQGRRSSQLS